MNVGILKNARTFFPILAAYSIVGSLPRFLGIVSSKPEYTTMLMVTDILIVSVAVLMGIFLAVAQWKKSK